MSEPTQRDLDTAHKLQRQANPIGIAHALADARAEGWQAGVADAFDATAAIRRELTGRHP